MPFGHKAGPTIVYSYYCRPPSSIDTIEQQMRKAHIYRNALVELELTRRRRYAEILKAAAPDLAQAEADAVAITEKIEALRIDIRRRNSSERRKTGTKDEQIQIKQWTRDRSDIWKRVTEMKTALREDEGVIAASKTMNEEISTEQKKLRADCGVYWGCVDEQTEILTDHGWKKGQSFRGDELVATYNRRTRHLEWQRAEGKTEGPYTGPMLEVRNARLDMLLTPNHRVVSVRENGHVKTTKVAITRADCMPTGNSPSVEIPQAAHGLEHPEQIEMDPHFANVLGWVIAEGNFPKGHNGVVLHQSETANKPYCEQIRQSLTLASLRFTESTGADGMVRFYIPARGGHGKRIRDWIPDKNLTPALAFRLNREAALALWTALLSGDGNNSTTSSGRPRWRWSQKNRINLDLFQALGQRLGIATDLSGSRSRVRTDGVSVVGVRSQPYSTWQSKKEIARWVGYEGTVWCPATPNGTWVARRNGSIFVTGNSYLTIERAIPRTGPPPKFHAWRGEGKVAVQLQGGMTMAQVYAGEDSRFRIKRPPDKAYENPKPNCATKRLWRTTAMLRIGSAEDKSPIWTEVPVLLHRLPPDDAVLKWAWLTRRRIHGTEWRWQLQLVLERASGWESQDCAKTGTVAVDIGWRIFDDRLRVAYWVGDDGRHGELSIPLDVLERWWYAESINSIRARIFDERRAELAETIREADIAWPEWLAEALQHVGQWRSADRLRHIVRRWADQRFDGDEEVFTELKAWRKQDLHMQHISQSVREQAIDIRKEMYLRFAAWLRRNYATVAVEEWNIRKMLERAPAEQTENDRAAKHYHRMASPGRLREIVTAKARNHIAVKAAFTTKTCNPCGFVNTFEAADALFHKCAKCGERWDQDQNAARNILAEAIRNAEEPVAASM